MMQDQRAEEVVPNALLKLSPELRNHIYEYLLEGIQTSPGVIDYYQITTSERDEINDLLSLLRICHQIRDELLSLLVKGQTLRIYLRHVLAFASSTLCSHFFGSGVPMETPFTVEIVRNVLPESATGMEADITSFLKLIVCRPNVQLKFSRTAPYETLSQEAIGRDLTRIFSPSHRHAWKSALNTSVARVEFHEEQLVPKNDAGLGGEMKLVLQNETEKPSMPSLGISKQNLRKPPWRDREWAFVHTMSENE